MDHLEREPEVNFVAATLAASELAAVRSGLLEHRYGRGAWASAGPSAARCVQALVE